MRALLLGARGAVGAVVGRELTETGHLVTAAGRLATDGAVVDLGGDLSTLRTLAADHDVVINATGVERADLSAATRETPLVEVSATGAYLDRLRDRAAGPLVLGAGLAPGLSTILAAAVLGGPGDDVDVLVMLGAGERHGSAAVAWTVGLVGTDVHRPPEGGIVRNLRGRTRATGPDGRLRRYVRADFPDHLLLADRAEPRIRSYLALDSSAMTAALWLVGQLPALRETLRVAPHLGTDRWHVIARNRRTGQERHVGGRGQSAATGRLVALAAIRAANASFEIANMADLVRLDEAVAALRRDTASATT